MKTAVGKWMLILSTVLALPAFACNPPCPRGQLCYEGNICSVPVPIGGGCTSSADCGLGQSCHSGICQSTIDPCYNCPRGSHCGSTGHCEPNGVAEPADLF